MKLHDYTRDYVGACVTEQDAWSVLRRLCEEIGTRLSGSEEEVRAAEMVKGELARSGLETSIEEFSFTGWKPGTSTVRIREGRQAREIPSHPLGWSPGASVQAPLVDAGRGMREDFQRLRPGRKIVMVCSENSPDQKDIHRSHKYSWAEEAGASGFLFYDKRPGGLVAMGSARLDPRAGTIPAAGISFEDAMVLRRKGEGAVVEISCTSRHEPVVSRNTVGFRKGELEEEVLVCGHMDSWFSQGAVDNGSGISMLMELARLTGRYALKRSVRFVGFGSEELGLLGSRAYLRAHPDLSRVVCVLNLDCSALNDGVLTVTTNETPSLHAFMTELGRALHLDLEVPDGMSRYSDHFPFREQGVPGAAFLLMPPG
jgi:Iap family predicted aminopeptidase